MRNEQQGPGAGSKSESDRRSSVRLPIEMWVEELTEGNQVFRRAGNLSRGGLHLDHTIPMPVGSRVRLRFTLPGDTAPIQVSAEIVSISTNSVLGMGVKFVDIAFSFVPGQVGVSEGVFAMLFGAVGLPGAAGLTLALVRRTRAILVAAVGMTLFATGD